MVWQIMKFLPITILPMDRNFGIASSTEISQNVCTTQTSFFSDKPWRLPVPLIVYNCGVLMSLKMRALVSCRFQK